MKAKTCVCEPLLSHTHYNSMWPKEIVAFLKIYIKLQEPNL